MRHCSRHVLCALAGGLGLALAAGSAAEDGPTPLDAVERATPRPLDAVDEGATLPLEAAAQEDGWEPPPCSDVAVDPAPLPEGSGDAAWSRRLRAAQDDVRQSRQRVETAEAAYARGLHSEHPRGPERAALVRARDAARAEYARARCTLPVLVERARRAGVRAEVLRPYR